MPKPPGPRQLARALDAHREALAACRRCANAPDIVPIVSLARSPRAMLVGQAPGQTERGGGRPFAGRAGSTLFKWLAQAGLSEDQARRLFYISAITRCYPGPHPAGRGDRVPSPAERARCSDWLDGELRIIRPRLIVPVGKLAIERFVGIQALSDVVGREHTVKHEGGSSIVIPLPHPSGASSWIYQRGHMDLLQKSLELLAVHVRALEGHTRSVA
jgi:uracil-DNA glycosylase